MQRRDLTIPEGWRALEDHEKTELGDKLLYNVRDGSVPYKDVNLDNNHLVGMPQNHLTGMAIRRVKSEWIDKNDRMPIIGDYEPSGFIQVWQQSGTPIHLRVGAEGFTYWRPVPPIPKPVEKPIVVNSNGTGHLVVFHKDGSLVVGCTEISSELFEQIAKRRQEKIES